MRAHLPYTPTDKPTNDHDARTESETDPAMPKDEDIGLAARRFAVHLQRMLMQA